MKTSLKKLLHHHNRKHGNGRSSSSSTIAKDTQIQPLAQFDDLAKASQEMEDMRDCYDSLLSAAAVAANSAYEFSDSLREMGVCLLQKIAVNDDEETGKVMLMLGKVQFELQKFVDTYRSHIFQTITVPSDSLVNELHNLEEMKHQCDEKKELYEYMRGRHRERGIRSKNGNGESFTSQQILAAKDEFDEEATLFVFRLKSLKQGQSRSLLTQAARHHASQLSLFRKAINTLEAVEPHVKLATQQQHIDYHFSGLDDEGEDEDEDEDDNNNDGGSEEDDDGDSDEDDDSCTSSSNKGDDHKELSFDYRRDNPWPKLISASRNNLEVGNMKLSYKDSFVTDPKMLSRSAPLLPQQKVDPKQLRSSASRKFHSYVLPKPGDPKTSISTASDNFIPVSKSSPQLNNRTLFHSCPLEPHKNDKLFGTANSPVMQNLKSIQRDMENFKTPPPPLTDKFHHYDLASTIKPKPQFFSGPLTSKPYSVGQSLSSSSSNHPQFSSGPLLRNPNPNLIQRSPKVSPVHSPTFNSSPRISELHELPRPPLRLLHTSSKSSGFTGFSAPLVSRISTPNNSTKKTLMRKPASRLPTPLQTSSSSPRQQLDTDDSASPPLTPLGLANLRTK